MRTVKIAFFDAKNYDREFFTKEAAKIAAMEKDGAEDEKIEFQIDYISDRLNPTTVSFARGHDAVCIFANDQITKQTAETLREFGIRIIALRSVGYNNVDTKSIIELNLANAAETPDEQIRIVHIPSYSPHATAEFAVALLQNLNRKIHKAYARTRDSNFDTDGFVGTEIFGKTVGIVGAGAIGKAAAEIFKGYGATVLLNAAHQDQSFGQKIDSEYVNLEEIFKNSDFIMLFCPLLSDTRHIINNRCIQLMKKDALIVSTGRSSLIDSGELFDALNSGRIKGVAFDIFEEDRQNLYGDDWAPSPIRDENFDRLLRLPNVLMTHHQAYLTAENLSMIASVTLDNIRKIVSGEECPNIIK